MTRYLRKGKGLEREFIKVHEKLRRRQKAINKSAPKVLEVIAPAGYLFRCGNKKEAIK